MPLDPRVTSYFPGDPPAFETVATFSLLLAAALVMLGALFFLLTIHKTWRRFRRPSLRLISALMGLLAIPLGFATLGIGRRHFGEWAELKASIRHYSELVAMEVARSGSADQLPAVQARFFDPPPTFKFSALREPVKFRIMQTTPPYVGVDFGNGANAVFDPRTMICVYSD